MIAQPRIPTIRRTLVVLVVGLCLLGAQPARAAEADPDHRRTLGLVAAYERAPNWVVKALALMSLGERWHPAGNAIVLDALRSKDKRLRAFGLEAYRGTAPENVPVLFTQEVLDELIGKQLKEKNKFFRSEAKRLLMKTFPKQQEGWGTWWDAARETYTPPAWQDRAPPKKEAGHDTVARKSVVTRALELSQDGIELVLVIDSTGSMQPTIDAARKAMSPVIDVLQGLTSDLRIGLVHYRDRMDLGGGKAEHAGAKVLCKLSTNVRKVQRKLDGLKADGGGDIPERVYGGLWLATHREMGWSLPASKMVVVIGDAPPHREDVKPTIDLAKEAREHPAWILARKRKGPPPVVTGGYLGSGKKKVRVRPIFTSTFWTGPDPGKEGRHKIYAEYAEGARHFESIAEAGGGVFAVLKRRGNPKESSATIVTHLIGLTFGVEHQDAAKRLAERYIHWKRVGYIK